MSHLNLKINLSDLDCQKPGTFVSIANKDTSYLQETKYSTIKLVKNPFRKLPKIPFINQKKNNYNGIYDFRKNLNIVNYNNQRTKNNSVLESSMKTPFNSTSKINPIFINSKSLKNKTKYFPRNKFSYYSPKSKNKSAIFENFDFINKNLEKIENIKKKQDSKFTPSNNIAKNYKILYNDTKLMNPSNFHKKIMLKNIDIYNNSKLNEFLEMQHKEKLKELEKEKFREENVSTGIYGSPKNIISEIRARIERLKMNDDYIKAKPELRELVKDELMIAKVKLKIKPKKIMIDGFNQIKPLYMEKTEKFKYLAQKNKMVLLNRNANVPSVVEDDQIMYNLFDDAYKIFKDKKYQIHDNSIL